MPIFKIEDIISWIDDHGKILCPECFQKEFRGHYPSEWTPIISEDIKEESILECDDCGERSVN